MMPELTQENWIMLIAALVIAALVVVWFLMSSRKTSIQRDDSADDGEGAKRNQSLIDAPPATLKQPDLDAAAKAEPVPVAKSAANTADDLSHIKGVGPKLKTMLIDLGVTSFAQIAAWTDADIDAIDAKLGRFEGRIRRDNWPHQARFLAADDTAAYEAEFGRL